MRWAIFWSLLIGAILLPFVLFGDWLEAVAASVLGGNAYRPTAIAAIALMLVLDVILPVPSSLVSTAAGALLGFRMGALVVWASMTVGCAVAYLLGRLSTAAATRLVGEASLQRAASTWKRYGWWGMLVCRAVPVVAEASVVFSGIVRAPMWGVLGITLAANAGIAAAYAAAGSAGAQNASVVLIFLGAIGLPGIAMLLWRRFTHGSGR